MQVDPAQETVNALATRLYQRADPMALAVLEALEIWCQLAQATGHQSQLSARAQIQRYVTVLDRMRAIAAGLVLADKIPEGQNGRTQRPDSG